MYNNKLYFECVRDKKIFCIFSEANVSNKKIVIMSHGFRGSNIGPARQFVDFQRILNKEGYSVLRFDQPNSGNSEGDYSTSSFKEWVDTIVYLANKFIKDGYEVNLLGQSMGASATIVATTFPSIKNMIPCILVWVPDPKSDISVVLNMIYEEGGQKHYGSFWQEAKDSNILQCLRNYQGKIHLVYGENDKYVKKELKDKTIKIVKDKGQAVMILKGQDHSPWEFDLAQEIYKQELIKLKE